MATTLGRQTLAFILLVLGGLYLLIPSKREFELKKTVDRVLDERISVYLHNGSVGQDTIYDLQNSLLSSSCCSFNTVLNLCDALVGKQVLFVGPETTFYLHTLWLHALESATNKSLSCTGPQFCTFHHVCGSARPTYHGRVIKFPHVDELIATNSSIIRYVRSYTLYASKDPKDREYTEPTVNEFTGIRIHNAYWLRQARKADVIVLNHGPLPAPVSTYEGPDVNGNWTFPKMPSYFDGSPIINAALHATLTSFLPSVLQALYTVSHSSLKKQRPLVVWHGSWLMDAGCSGRKKRAMGDSLNFRWVDDPWTLYYNTQVYMQNRVMYALMPHLGGVFYGLPVAERGQAVRKERTLAAECLLFDATTRRGKEMQNLFLDGMYRIISSFPH